MSEKRTTLALIVAAIGLLSIGYGACWVTKPAPEPVVEMTLRGLFVNGKHVDLDKFKIPLPITPDKSKRKPGDLPSGDLPKAGPAASADFPKDMVVKNRGGSDGAGIPVSACLETVARKLGIKELDGFTNFSAERPGGQWPEKVTGQIDAYTKGAIHVTWAEASGGTWKPYVAAEVENGNLPVLLLSAKLQGYGGNEVAHSIIVINCRLVPPVGDYVLTYVDCNFPGKQFTTWAGELPNEMTVGTLPIPRKIEASPDGFVLFDQDPLSPYPHMQNALAVVNRSDKLDCPCGESCACKPCHCHAAKPITFDSEDDPPMVVGQRGGKPVEAFGIEALAGILRELKEAVFGTNGKPGLKDDISGGLKDFWGSVKVGFIVAGGVTLTALGWIGLSLQRIADSAAK